MPSNEPLGDLEREALDLLLAGDHPVLRLLRAQRRSLTVRGRVWTGSGFLADLEVSPGVPRLSPLASFGLSDVNGEVAGVPCGFVLHVRDGLVDTLEAHTWVGEWPAEARPWRLHYVRPRDGRGPQLEPADERDVGSLRLPAA